MIRTTFTMIGAAILTVVLGGWILISSLLRLPWTRPCCDRFARFWSHAILVMAGARVRLEGVDRVDWNQPLVVVANHQSWFDVFALEAHLPTGTRFVAKEELGRIPIFGAAWKACGHISIRRDDRSQAIASLKKAGSLVQEDNLAIILFPEGTRSLDGSLQPFKKGAFVLGIQTGLPVLPVGISGSRAVMPKGAWRMRPGEIRVRFGTPIPTESLTMKDRDELLNRAWEEVAGLMEDPGKAVGDVEGPPINVNQSEEQRR